MSFSMERSNIMGVTFELNWYLVIESIDTLAIVDSMTFKVRKRDNRIYPIGGLIPIIEKENECLGIVQIKGIDIREDYTDIIFIWNKDSGISTDIKDHYYQMYLQMKKS